MARRRDEHPHYSQCVDPDCPRFPCRVFKEGFKAGYEIGKAAGESAGYAAGMAAGYTEGFADGASAVAGSGG